MKTINENKKRRVIIYFRVSTDKQAERGYSLNEQNARLIEYCRQKGYEIVASIKEDFSAKNFDNRPAFQEMLRDIKSKKIIADLFLCVKVDRFSRDLLQTMQMRVELKRLGIAFTTIELDVESENPHTSLIFNMHAALAQFDNEQRAVNTQRGMRQAQREGRWMSTAPRGYSDDTSTGKRLIIPNNDAKYVVKAFEQLATGLYTIEEVRKQLYREGFKATRSPFHRMLRNPVYKGKILIKEWKNEAEEVADGLHEAIVSEEIFDKVQDVLYGRKKSTKAKAVKDENLPLRGFLECKCCAGNLTGSKSTSGNMISKTYYYHCQNGCKERFRAVDANNEFIKYLDDFEIKDEVLNLYTLVLQDIFNKDEKDRKEDVRTIESQIENLVNKKNALLDKYADNVLSQSDYESGKKRYDENINSFISRKMELEREYKDFMSTIQFGFGLLKDLPVYYDKASIEVKQKIIGSIFPQKLIYSDKKYRTTKVNEVLTLICSNINTYGDVQYKKGEGYIKPSPLVARRGQLSNQIIDRFSKIYELKGVLNVSMLEPALMPSGYKVAI